MLRTAKQDRILALMTIVLGILMILGEILIVPACPKAGNGKWMNCHWASQAKCGIGAMVILTSLLDLILLSVRKKERGGDLLVSNFCWGLMTVLVQSVLIGGCMGKNMVCRTHNFPPAYFAAGLLMAAGAVSFVLVLRSRHHA